MSKVKHELYSALGDKYFLGSLLLALIVIFIFGYRLFLLSPFNLFVEQGNLTLNEVPVLNGFNNGLMAYQKAGQAKQQSDSGRLNFYKVTLKSGEGLSLLAKQHNLNVSTLLNVNKIEDLSTIGEGSQLIIPSEDGLMYRVKSFDTLDKLAINFKVDRQSIAQANNLKNEKLFKGETIFIPNAALASSVVDKIYDNYLSYPLAGQLKTFFGKSFNSLVGMEQFNEGITFNSVEKQTVYAAGSGIVTKIAFHSSYGYYVVVTHANNLQSFYGYLAWPITAKLRSKVDSTTPLGYVGQSGFTNGHSLYFALFKDGKAIDPLLYLR
jgi:LysM repeat protein